MVRKDLWIASTLILGLIVSVSGITATGLKMPEVPITGGKKQNRATDGNVVGVQPMPGIASPKPVSWDELTTKYYNFKHALPAPKPMELVGTKGMMSKNVTTTVDLPTVMKRYTKATFTDPKYGNPEEWAQSFGNILAEFKAIKGNGKKTDELLEKLKTQYPAIYKDVQPYLTQLVRDDFLYSSKWDPYKDESVKGKQNDGILFVDHWTMQADASRDPRWNQHLGEHKVYQGAAVLYADVQTIKEMEKDYANYFSQIGQDYVEVYPVQNSYLKGVDKNGNEFSRMELFLRNDLPFPYDTCAYVMNILEYYNADGNLISEYYSDNQDDLNWMAGRDTYFPIYTTKGDLVGNMIVTVLDFDIKNVPERDIDRIVSMKAGLGNMKRISEMLLDKKRVATTSSSAR